MPIHFSPQLPFDFSISEKYLFSNFLVSEKNIELVRLLHDFPACNEHIVFIWGNSGVGKSHLLQALCHESERKGEPEYSEDNVKGMNLPVNNKFQELQCLYLPMKKIKMFGPDVFTSLHHMDVICIDDFDCVVGERDWEESIFEFFNRSREEGVKLLVTAKNSPRGIQFELPDLASRMSWGMIYQLSELNDNEKISALDQRARDKHMPMSAELLQYIFTRHSRDLQSLVAVLDRLDQLSLAEKRKLTIPFVREVMAW